MADRSEIKTTAEQFLAAKKLELAAMNLRHYNKIQQEQVQLDELVRALQTAQDRAKNGKPEDFTEILAEQAQLLNAAFHFYLNKATDSPYSADNKVMMALLAQRQSLGTVNSWQRLERLEFAKARDKEKKEKKLLRIAKRTEQNKIAKRQGHAPLEC